MFWYISFLRPPPAQSIPSFPITITPQIANDLRTNLYDNEQDIYYSWSPTVLTTKPSSPLKLTTWRQSNAYKELSVPPPFGVREGQSYRLVLCASPNVGPYIGFTEGSKEFGRTHPFSVISMPITFTKNAVKAKGKQERIERVYRFPLPTASESTAKVASMKITEQTSFDLDKKIWDSGIGLSSWLADIAKEQIQNPLVQKLKNVLFSVEARNVIELGAGTGIVAITLGALRADCLTAKLVASLEPGEESSQQENVGSIYTTDLPSALPLLTQNISSNTHLFRSSVSSLVSSVSSTTPQIPGRSLVLSPGTESTAVLDLGCTPIPEVLDWDEPLPEFAHQFGEKGKGRLDMIIMADVTYNTSSFPSLVKTIRDLVQLGSLSLSTAAGYSEDETKYPLILIGYKQRDRAERELFRTLSSQVGFRMTKVDEVPGASRLPGGGKGEGSGSAADSEEEGRGPVEIWIGELIGREGE
ncbi:hypothetical protein D9758_008751 [Tetrapyrgos nigripes]|uniref:Uncharacterized protein n=1 Tax=Tetrapyrgos nigripes TaxID=182062 RepID=A0A8H5D3T1_9AGAR|nr:hypothetical protein D9758_008751 [Tetrapyrgos nigripes]